MIIKSKLEVKEKLHVKPHSYQKTQTRNNWEQVKQNRSFSRHNTENCNIITQTFIEPLSLEDITSNNSGNPDFVVTPSAQTNILTSRPRPKFMQAQNHSRRPNICTTENYLWNYNPSSVPRNSSYANFFKFGNKIFVVGDTQIKKIKRLDFNKELRSGKALFRSFSGAKSRQLDHYIIPTLVDDNPDLVLLHVGTNDILNNANDTKLANNMINIGLNSKNDGANKFLISSILVKKNPKLNPVIRRVNDQLCDLCEVNGFLLIKNDMIKTDHLWRDLFERYWYKYLVYKLLLGFEHSE